MNDIYKGMQEAFRRFETEEIKDSDLERLKIMQETMMYNVMMALESKTQAWPGIMCSEEVRTAVWKN